MVATTASYDLLDAPAASRDSSSSTHLGPHASSSPEDSSSGASLDSLHKRGDDDDYAAEPPRQRVRHDEAEDGASGRRGASRGAKDRKPITAKRKEQNRRAQQAFRDRKEQRVHDLENKIAELQSESEQHLTENSHLRDLVNQLREENARLASAPPPVPVLVPNDFTVPLASTSAASLDTSVASDAFQTSFLTSFTGFGPVSAPTSIVTTTAPALPTPLMSAEKQLGGETGLWRETTPSADFPSSTFGNLEDFLSFGDDDVPVPRYPSGPSSSTSEPRTPGEHAKPVEFDLDKFCGDFQERASCDHQKQQFIEQAHDADRKIYEQLNASAPPAAQ